MLMVGGMGLHVSQTFAIVPLKNGTKGLEKTPFQTPTLQVGYSDSECFQKNLNEYPIKSQIFMVKFSLSRFSRSPGEVALTSPCLSLQRRLDQRADERGPLVLKIFRKTSKLDE